METQPGVVLTKKENLLAWGCILAVRHFCHTQALGCISRHWKKLEKSAGRKIQGEKSSSTAGFRFEKNAAGAILSYFLPPLGWLHSHVGKNSLWFQEEFLTLPHLGDRTDSSSTTVTWLSHNILQIRWQITSTPNQSAVLNRNKVKMDMRVFVALS